MRRLRQCYTSVLMIVLASGCAAAPQRDAADPLAGVPLDFTLTLGVLGGGDPAADRKESIAARWVLFPDGSLCYEQTSGARAQVDSLPPLTRVLSRAQMAEVWSHVRQLGLVAHDSSEAAINPKLVQANAGEVIHLADVRAHGRHRTVVQRTSFDGDEPALAGLARHLGELSWAEQFAAQPQRPTAPKRYNFGPDPYARYRR